MSATAALNDQALTELCWLLEQADPRLAPDAVWLSGKPGIYEHLREIGALALSNDLASDIVCRDCCSETFRPEANPDGDRDIFPYRGYCLDCGWIPLRPEQARLWHAHPIKIARWLASAMQLTQRYSVETVIEGVLWRLGEIEHRRKRRTLFFGRRLAESGEAVREALGGLVAPGAEVIITTSDIATLRNSALAAFNLVPLRAVTHLRKAGFVIENLDSYLAGSASIETSDETSLRLMYTKRVALIEGKEHKLSPQVYEFLKIIEAADGDEVHKHHIAEGLKIDEAKFRSIDIFKRHRVVFDTFVETDYKGYYWIKPDFIIGDGVE